MNEKEEKSPEINFLEELVVIIGGEAALKNLNELADIGNKIIGTIKSQDMIPVEKVERWNELIMELYPNQNKD